MAAPRGGGSGNQSGENGERSSSGSSPGAPKPTLPTKKPIVTATGHVQRTSATGVPAIDLGGTKNEKEFRRHLLNSTFHDERTEFDSVLGKKAPPKPEEQEETTDVAAVYDGKTPAKGVSSRDLWKGINAPLQSREGRRSAKLYQLVIDQFAVGNNPRYEPDGDKLRTHIFIWDVTKAMNIEVPHFVGARELSAGQTCHWVRTEGPSRGWFKADPFRALEAANEGMPVLAMPRDIKLNLMAVVRPGEMGQDRRPLLSAAARQRGNDLLTMDALGVMAVEYFYHP
jgi:hypothetical protein